MMFPHQWTRACLSLDSANGRSRLVVDGIVLAEREDGAVDPEFGILADRWPSALNLVLGRNTQGAGLEYDGKITDVNVFSVPLTLAEMVQQTTAGGEKCGAPGDYLSWEEAEWELHSMARSYTIQVSEGPCRATSSLHVYTEEFDTHIQCMQHCEKLGGGRSPLVQTPQQWKGLQLELQKITLDLKVLGPQLLWLAATDEKNESLWRDYYTAR
jgi:hypothetical protein